MLIPLEGLGALNRQLVGKGETIASPRPVVLDMDSTEIPVYGRQEQGAYNGHFESTCYQGDRQLVAHQPAAAAGENRRPSD